MRQLRNEQGEIRVSGTPDALLAEARVVGVGKDQINSSGFS